MNPRMLSIAVVLAINFVPAEVGAGDKPPSAPAFRETNSLQAELQKTKSTLESLAARTRRVDKAADDAHAKVAQASAVIRRVDQIDDLLVRVIRQLKPLAKLPATRSLGPVVANLTKLQSMVHKVRVQGDNLQKKALAPMQARLKQLDLQLAVAIREIDQTIRESEQTGQHLKKLREVVASRGNQKDDIATLEALSKGTLAAIRPANSGLKSFNDASAAVETDLKGLANDLSALTATGPALQNLLRDLAPVQDTARDLDKVLNQRIAVKVLDKNIGFTVRQVIEGPGKISDIILKPLEKLASDALNPIIRSLKLEIQAPAELVAIERSLTAAAARTTSVTQSADQLESALRGSPLATLRTSFNGLNAKSPSPFGKGIGR